MDNLIIISEEQAKKSIDMKTALDIIRDAYRACYRGDRYAGGRIVIPIRGEENCGQWLVANCLDVPVFGAKFASVFPGNVPKGMPSVLSQISLYSAETGEPLALIGANYLTAIKTGGSAGVATDLMAKKDASKLAIIGSGTQAFTNVMAVQEVRELTELRIFDMFPDRIDAFAERIKGIQNRDYKIVKCATANEAVSGADIVSTTTTSLTPVFDADALQPGTHINAVGSFTPFMQEIPEEAVSMSARVITEHVEGLWEAAGDILIPVEKGIVSKDKVVGSISDCLAGDVIARENDEEITMYESVGSCVLDVAIAIAVYEANK